MIPLWLRRLVRRKEPDSARCASCPLSVCARGCRAAILRMDCEGGEASRLRNLGLFEGACVRVVESQDGLLLDIRGTRVALGASLASVITVLPLGS